MIGGQVDVEAGDIAAIALRLAGRRVDLGLLERDRVAPISQRDAAVGTRALRDAADREPTDGSAREASGRALPARRRVGVAGDARRSHLAGEERERADRARSDGAGVRPDSGRRRDRDGTSRQKGAVARIGESGLEADCARRRRDGGRDSAGLVRNDHLDAVGASGRAGLRAVRSRAR